MTTPTPNTITGLDVLLASVEGLGEYRSVYISDADGSIPNENITCPELEEVTVDFFVNALVHVEGKGTWKCTAYAADKTLTLDNAGATGLAAGDVAMIAFWKGSLRGKVERAINQAIRQSYWRGHDSWYREVALDPNNNTLSDGVTTWTFQTIEKDTFDYALPVDCAYLAQVGIKQDDSSPVLWLPRQDLWRTHGGEGNMLVRFGATHFSFPKAYDGKTLYYRYEAREPLLTAFDATTETQLPYDYFQAVVPEILNRRSINTASQEERAQDSMSLPQQQLEMQRALRRVGALKPAMQSVSWGFLDGN